MKLRKFKSYFAFTKASILESFAYKFSAFGWLLGDALSILILFYIWQAIFKNSPTPEINGMTFEVMISFLIFARVTTTLTFQGFSFWELGYDIYEGNIAINLIKPVNYRFKLLSSSFGGFMSSIILMFIPLMIISQVALHLTLQTPIPSIDNIIFFMISAFLSFIIYDSFSFLIAQIALFTNALFGLMITKNVLFAFLSGSLLPTAFFPEWLQTVTRILPFAALVETPTFILMGRLSVEEILISIATQVGWIVVLGLLCELSFKSIRKRVVSVGG